MCDLLDVDVELCGVLLTYVEIMRFLAILDLLTVGSPSNFECSLATQVCTL